MSITLLCANGNTVAEHSFKLTGIDAFRYSFAKEGLISGLISFFAGKKVDIEAHNDTEIPACLSKKMVKLLDDRTIKPVNPEVSIQPGASIGIAQSLKNTEEILYRVRLKDIESLRHENNLLKQENTRLTKKIIAGRSEVDLKHIKEQHEESEIEKKLTKEVNDKRATKDNLLSAISAKMGRKFRANNPEVADLNDPNRPTKLETKLGSLYENQWTDAYLSLTDEEAFNFTEKKAIQVLLETFFIIRSETESFIKSSANKEIKALAELKKINELKELNELKKLKEEGMDENNKETNEELKEINKKIKEIGDKNDYKLSTIEEDILYRKIHSEDGYKKNEAELRKIVYAKIKESLFENMNPSHGDYETLVKYIDQCSSLLYFALSIKPPMTFECAKEGVAINLSEYKKYTCDNIIVDYPVWPAIRLYQDGPLMTKGVAQPKTTIKDKKTSSK